MTVQRALMVALAVAGLQACASAPARPSSAPLKAVPTPAPLLLGVNDGGHTGVPREIVDRYCQAPRELVIRAAVSSAIEADFVVASLKPCPSLHALLLVERADVALVRTLATYLQSGVTPLPVWGIELGNELDLAGLTPPQFADFVGAGFQSLRSAGFVGRIVIGGIYTVDRHSPQDFEEYLKPAIAVCPGCVIGLHWYGDTSDYWLARVQALGAEVAVTEFGIPACTPAQETAQNAYLRQQLAAYSRTGNVSTAIVYQRLSAPAPCDDTDASHLAHFGFERPDGSLKPAAAVLTGGAP